MKIMFAVLSWNNDFTKTLESIKTSPENIIVCHNTNRSLAGTGYVTMAADSSVAKAKNSIINRARELGADKLFILEDDIEVIDMSIFDKYISIMDILNQGVIFYGYNSTRENRVYNMPNPSLIVRISPTFGELYFNRFIVTSCLGFDLAKNPLLFDEDLKLLEITEYLQRCSDNGVIRTGNGFHVDIPESWKFFNRIEVPNKRNKTPQMVQEDRQTLHKKNIQLKLDMIVDTLIVYLKTINFPEKI